MKLHFRGVDYNYQPPNLDMTDEEVVGIYRGKPWKIHKYRQSCHHKHPSRCLIYRGVHYKDD